MHMCTTQHEQARLQNLQRTAINAQVLANNKSAADYLLIHLQCHCLTPPCSLTQQHPHQADVECVSYCSCHCVDDAEQYASSICMVAHLAVVMHRHACAPVCRRVVFKHALRDFHLHNRKHLNNSTSACRKHETAAAYTETTCLQPGEPQVLMMHKQGAGGSITACALPDLRSTHHVCNTCAT